jgi:hypothetical protein
MKRLILAAGLFAATLTASLHAQTMDLKANIPFDFRIGNAVFLSGEYSVRNSGGVLSVVQTTGDHKGGNFLTFGEDHPKTSTGMGTLEFHRYGDSYYLSKVWISESSVARALPRTPSEKELASHIGQPGTTTVALRTK